ncbi:imm11 family protein [Roseibaca sp. Y0-43]|uniref:imm11 family protein n=1 Tax=Roseibaca sp. Y0-43 TaxID=2816854 RepID=UPI001D0CAB8C|nr:DUF1629 domain-containing protein [Roseibaca sp. Y0-43]MCC1481286.1 hypothetical protein [Roseibaca sp. Y0-43]
MIYFAIRPDYQDDRWLRPNLSASETEMTDWDAKQWSLFRNIKTGFTGKLTSSSVDLLQSQTVHINNVKNRPLTVLGAHGMAPDDIVLVSGAIKSVIEELAPKAFEFVRMPKLKDHATGRFAAEADLYFARARYEADAVDTSEAPLKELRAVSPGWRKSKFRGKYALRGRKLPKTDYFREAKTGIGFCTESFKTQLEIAGATGWVFFPCAVSGR